MNEQELKDMINEGVYKLLKSSEFRYIYKHLVSKSKDSVLEKVKHIFQDELNDLATEGVHTEQMDQYHSSTSASVDSDTILELTEIYKSDVGDLKDLYTAILSN